MKILMSCDREIIDISLDFVSTLPTKNTLLSVITFLTEKENSRAEGMVQKHFHQRYISW